MYIYIYIYIYICMYVHICINIYIHDFGRESGVVGCGQDQRCVVYILVLFVYVCIKIDR